MVFGNCKGKKIYVVSIQRASEDLKYCEQVCGYFFSSDILYSWHIWQLKKRRKDGPEQEEMVPGCSEKSLLIKQ